jgi:hypothetical protein
MMKKPPVHITYYEFTDFVNWEAYKLSLDDKVSASNPSVCAKGLLDVLRKYVKIKGKPKKIWLLWYEKPRRDTIPVLLDGYYIVVERGSICYYFADQVGFPFEPGKRYGRYHVEVWYE